MGVGVVPLELTCSEDDRLARNERSVEHNRLIGQLVNLLVAVLIKFIDVGFVVNEGGVTLHMVLSVIQEQVRFKHCPPTNLVHLVHRKATHSVTERMVCILYGLRHLEVPLETGFVLGDYGEYLLIVGGGELHAKDILEEFFVGNLECEVGGVCSIGLKTADHNLGFSFSKLTGNAVLENHKRLGGKIVEFAADVSILCKTFSLESNLGREHFSCTYDKFSLWLNWFHRIRSRVRSRVRCHRRHASESE